MGFFNRLVGRIAGPLDADRKFSESRMLEGDWAAVEHQLLDNPQVRGVVQRLGRDVRQLSPSLSLAEVPTASARAAMNLLVKDVASVYGTKCAARLSPRDAVVLDLDDPLAEAQVTDQAGALVVLSSGLITACALHAAAAGALEKGRGEDVVDSTTAALRFYHLQQAHFGLSGVHDVRRLVFSRWRRAAELAMLFIIGHELAHHTLGHARDSSESWSADRELEADRWAGELLRRGPCARAYAHGSGDRIIRGIHVALNTLHCRDRATFIRNAGTHPKATERWHAATEDWATADKVLSAGRQIGRVADEAADLDVPLSTGHWAALRTSRVWDTTMHEPNVYSTAEALDRLSGATRTSLLDVLAGMASAFPDSSSSQFGRELHRSFASQQSLSETLEQCGVSFRDVSRICSPSTPLTRIGLQKAFERSSLWPESTSGRDTVVTCAIAAALTLQVMKEQ